MPIYSEEQTSKYTALRDTLTATDEVVFSYLQEIGVEGKDVLDFGCGDGRYGFKLLEMGARSVVGMDSSPAMIDRALADLNQRRAEHIQFFIADGSQLPLPDQSFDLVFSNFVLHHFVDTLQPLQEIHRVLRPNGYLICTFNSAVLRKPVLFNSEIPLRLGSATDYVIVRNLLKNDDEIKAHLTRVGFEVLHYQEEANPVLSIDPAYGDIGQIERMRTIICVAQRNN